MPAGWGFTSSCGLGQVLVQTLQFEFVQPGHSQSTQPVYSPLRCPVACRPQLTEQQQVSPALQVTTLDCSVTLRSAACRPRLQQRRWAGPGTAGCLEWRAGDRQDTEAVQGVRETGGLGGEPGVLVSSW